jgi:hypothetical protein
VRRTEKACTPKDAEDGEEFTGLGAEALANLTPYSVMVLFVSCGGDMIG